MLNKLILQLCNIYKLKYNSKSNLAVKSKKQLILWFLSQENAIPINFAHLKRFVKIQNLAQLLPKKDKIE